MKSHTYLIVSDDAIHEHTWEEPEVVEPDEDAEGADEDESEEDENLREACEEFHRITNSANGKQFADGWTLFDFYDLSDEDWESLKTLYENSGVSTWHGVRVDWDDENCDIPIRSCGLDTFGDADTPFQADFAVTLMKGKAALVAPSQVASFREMTPQSAIVKDVIEICNVLEKAAPPSDWVASMATFFGALLQGHGVELDLATPGTTDKTLAHWFRTRVPADHVLWKYVKVVGEPSPK